jgi:hypothetical protein
MSGPHLFNSRADLDAAIAKRKGRCDVLTIENKPCGKPIGTCIHKYVPTLFGQRPQKENTNA